MAGAIWTVSIVPHHSRFFQLPNDLLISAPKMSQTRPVQTMISFNLISNKYVPFPGSSILVNSITNYSISEARTLNVMALILRTEMGGRGRKLMTL